MPGALVYRITRTTFIVVVLNARGICCKIKVIFTMCIPTSKCLSTILSETFLCVASLLATTSSSTRCTDAFLGTIR